MGKDKAKLCDSQLNVYLECMLAPSSVKYNNTMVVTYDNPKGIKVEDFKGIVDDVLRNHPALYSHIETIESDVYMVRDAFPENGICEIVEKIDETIKPFDLSKGPLVRVAVCKKGDKFEMFFDGHHTVTDGTSLLAFLFPEIAKHLSGLPAELEEIDAFDMYEKEEEISKSEDFVNANKYFEELFLDANMDNSLLHDFNEKEQETYELKRFESEIKLSGIEEALKEKGLRENTLFLGAYGYAMKKMIGTKDVVLGVGEAGRKIRPIPNTVSMFVKVLPVLIAPNEEQKGDEYLKSLQEQFHKSLKNDIVHLGEVYKKIGFEDNSSFVYHGALLENMEVNGIGVDIRHIPCKEAQSKLAVSVEKGQDSYHIIYEYRPDLYMEDTIKRLSKLVNLTVQNLLSDKPMKEYELTDKEEIELLDSFFGENAPYDTKTTFVDRFLENTLKYENKTALVYKEKTYTYGYLFEIVARMAEYLNQMGIGRGDQVGVLTTRGEQMVILPLGILLSGAAYQPLDPSYPPERLEFMCEDATTDLVITTNKLHPLIRGYKGKIILVDDLFNELRKMPEANLSKCTLPKIDDPFVLLYSSGTTGKPKGSKLSHKNLTSFISAYSHGSDVNSDSIVASYASFSFDAFVGDMFPTLYQGAELHILSDEVRFDFALLKQYLEDNKVSNIIMTTQVASIFAKEYKEVKHLKTIVCGGEKLVGYKADTNYRLINGYGPSECIVCVTLFPVMEEYEDIPIGFPMRNCHFFVIDGQGRRLPQGAPGELVISGPQVGLGYHGRPELNEKSFVENVFEEKPSDDFKRAYRTGDIVRFLPDGNMQFIGRRDLQVKIRGFRIELSEVEKVIKDFEKITDATVIAVDGKSGKEIHAYVVSKEKIDPEELGRFIRTKKPSYMVPSAMMQLDAIPMTPNQKVDKKKLPKIEKTESTVSEVRSLTKIEVDICEILKDILGEADFPVNRDFESLGITSITSIRLSSALYKKFGITISSKDLLSNATIISVENMIIEELLSGKTKEKAETKEEKASYPLTKSQLGIYLECQSGSSQKYNIPVIYKLPKEIDIAKLKEAIKSAVKLHPSMLCAVMQNEMGDPVLVPKKDMDIDVFSENVLSFPVKPTEFKFDGSPLFKIRFLTKGNEEYLMIEMHHIISDGTSMYILLDDIDKCYKNESTESESYTIFDFTEDEKEARISKEFNDAVEYYKSIFDGVSDDYHICADKKAEKSLGTKGYSLDINYDLIDKFCEDRKITKNVFFTGIFAILLSKYTAHEDAYFTTIYNGRTDPRTENLISMLVKTIPVFTEINPSTKITDFFKAFEERLSGLKKNDIYAFADAARDLSLSSDTMFIYQGEMGSAPSIGGYELTVVPFENDESKADICIELFDKKSSYEAHVEYNGGKYSDELISSVLDAYETTVKSVLLAEKIKDIEICSEKALRQFDNFNDTYFELKFEPIYKVIEEQVEKNKEKIAIYSNPLDTDGICEKESITYKELNDLANVLAHELISLGVKPKDNVGIMLGRNMYINISQFAILKTGSAFLYISPSYPDDRVSFIVNDCSLKALITTKALASEKKELLDSLNTKIVYVDDIKALPRDKGNIDSSVGPEDLAYMIYTSGSTGTPKGVTVTQQGLSNISNANEKNIQTYNYTADRVAACVAYTFDASIIDSIIALSNGKTICIASDAEIHDIEGFREMCKKYSIDGLTGTPALITSMLDDEEFEKYLKNFKSVIIGGEAFPKNTYEKLRAANSELKIVNAYGPSEATVACSASLLTDADNITIGTPLSNYKIYIIDKQNHILPMGALGELVIVGIGVGNGYIGRDDLTEKVFFKMNGERAYKSGDLSLINHKEEIMFHGRIDDQVKLRGLRIELGEIESAIGRCSGVVNCAVIVKGKGNNAYLASFYTAENDITPSKITEEIKKSLAEYMVPRVVIKLDSMPITANGKINKKALLDIKEPENLRKKTPPKTELERAIAEVFSSVLGGEEVFREDNFFEIGGSSLLASKVVMFLKSKMIEVEYQDIFDNQTVLELANFVEEKQGEKSAEIIDDDFDENKLPALIHNNRLEAHLVKREPLGDVLLTGATGFLGMHILKELIDTEEGHIYCFVRSSGFSSPESHMNAFSLYYFDECFLDTHSDRITMFDLNVTGEDLVETLKDYHFDTIINCAALVKHFASDDSIERVNVKGVEKLIEVALDKGARLIQISTTSVPGAHSESSLKKGIKMYEDQLFYIDNMNNKYCISKYKAECLMVDAIEKRGLRGKIIRVGNLMGRYSDGEFQINMNTNSFLKALRGFATIGKAPISNSTHPMDFSPIDLTAKVIVALSGTNDIFTAFNANNRLIFDEAKLFEACSRCGIPIVPTADDEYYEEYYRLLGDDKVNARLSGLVTNDIKGVVMVDTDNTFTTEILYRIGFSWPFIDDAYLERIINQLKTLGFFD